MLRLVRNCVLGWGIQYAAAAIEPRCLGVLDRPVKPDDESVFCGVPVA
ncbi:hypothetical protein ACVWZZ_000125 [Bradyrhizobium sp. LM6.10]